MEPQTMEQLLPAVMESKNLVSVPEKSRQLRTTEEETLAIALQSSRLISSPAEELKQCMRAIFFMVGLRPENWPSGEDKEFLHQFILENYGGHTASEIRLAFKMAITGKLDLPAKDVKCYENFSPLYFSSIMESYRRWARQAHEIIEKTEPIKAREYTEAEKKQIDFEYQCAICLDYWRKIDNLKAPL